MNIRTLTYKLFLCICSIGLLGACNNNQKLVSQNVRDLDANILRVAVYQDKLDTKESVYPINDEFLLRHVFDGFLTKVKTDYIKSSIVSEFLMDDTNNIVKIRLIDGLKFSDGSLIDADILLPWMEKMQNLGLIVSLNDNTTITIKYTSISKYQALEILSGRNSLLFKINNGRCIGTGTLHIINQSLSNVFLLGKNPYSNRSTASIHSKILVSYTSNYKQALVDFKKLKYDILMLDASTANSDLIDISYEYKGNISQNIRDNISTYAVVDHVDSLFSKHIVSRLPFASVTNIPNSEDALIDRDSIFSYDINVLPTILFHSKGLKSEFQDKILFGLKGLPFDSLRQTHFISLTDLQDVKNSAQISDYLFELNIDAKSKKLIHINSTFGKIVQQHYVKNVTITSNGFLNLNTVELHNAEKLN